MNQSWTFIYCISAVSKRPFFVYGETWEGGKQMEFDYFYGPEDAEQYQFYRIPKLLITSDQFKDVSVEAKLLYGLMLDRLSLSIKNGWFDAMNRAYIIYTIEDVMEDMHCRSQKACKLVSESEKNAGLIKKKRQGLGKPSLIYVLKFSTICPQNHSESKIKNFENQNSGVVKSENQEFRKSPGNKTNQKKTENNKTDPIYQSAEASPMTAKIAVSIDGMGRDEMEESIMDKRKSYELYFRKQLCIDDLKLSYPYDHGRIDEILELLVDTVCSNAATIRCAGEDRPAEVVKSRFMKLDYGHIQYVLDSIHDNTTDIRNIKAYMLTTLYNALMTIDHYYQADEIRKIFAKEHGIKPGWFSFNSEGGCPVCKGTGQITYDMAFAEPVVVPCEECGGHRYNPTALSSKYKGMNIEEVMSLTIEQAQDFFENVKIRKLLQSMIDVGLGYMTLGQPTSTLSGGEIQRAKLASELHREGQLYILDEPSTGLHNRDIEKLLALLRKLVKNRNTVVIVEHRLELIAQADWVIDMGADGGSGGGEVIYEGTPEGLHRCEQSKTAKYLKAMI